MDVNEFLNKYKVSLGLSLVGLVLVLGGIYSSNLTNAKSYSGKSYPKESLQGLGAAAVKVDVSGAVNAPGVYTLNNSSRVEDAIRVAGGFSENSNKNYISKYLNLSQKISDGQKIYVPFATEQGFAPGQYGAGQVAGAQTGAKVGINSADLAALDTLPGVGRSIAQKIISARPYSALEQLLSKKAVSRAVFEKIKDNIDLN